MKEIETVKLHPEGLTIEQEELADLLITTKTRAKVRRREQLPDGSYRFYNVVRNTSPFDFAQEGEFVFKLHEVDPAASLSPEYFSFRNLPENVLDLAGKILAEVKIKGKLDLCTGIPDAGVPLAKAYSRYSGVPFEEVFTKIETEKGRRIVLLRESVEKGKILLIVDDVVTKALSVIEAIEAANSSFIVIDPLVLVDREQGGAEKLRKMGFDLHSAYKHSQLLNFFLRTGRISQVRYNEIKEYLLANNK